MRLHNPGRGRFSSSGKRAADGGAPGGQGTAARRLVLRARVGAVSVTAAMAAGAWVGFALGLVLGTVLGALICWFAEAALQWQRDVGLTLGVTYNLLPFGDQVPVLHDISQHWYLVIPAAAVLSGLVWATLAALAAGLVAAGYNHASRHALVLVELPEAELANALQAAIDARPAGSGPVDVPAAAAPAPAPSPALMPSPLAPVPLASMATPGPLAPAGPSQLASVRDDAAEIGAAIDDERSLPAESGASLPLLPQQAS